MSLYKPEMIVRGDRVRLSDEGKRLLLGRRSTKLYPAIEGEYLGQHRHGFARVRFDGYTTAMYLHPDFVEKVR